MNTSSFFVIDEEEEEEGSGSVLSDGVVVSCFSSSGDFRYGTTIFRGLNARVVLFILYVVVVVVIGVCE